MVWFRCSGFVNKPQTQEINRKMPSRPAGTVCFSKALVFQTRVLTQKVCYRFPAASFWLSVLLLALSSSLNSCAALFVSRQAAMP